jgi:hypothetical protein
VRSIITASVVVALTGSSRLAAAEEDIPAMLGANVAATVAVVSRSTPSTDDTEVQVGPALGLKAYFLMPVSRALRVGPELSISSVPFEIGYVVGTGGIQALLTPSLPTQQWSPRLAATLGLALSLPAEPRDFAIEHEIPPSAGLYLGLALGMERRTSYGSWSVDAAAGGTEASHSHRALDSRTGENTREKEIWRSMMFGLQFGLAYQL